MNKWIYLICAAILVLALILILVCCNPWNESNTETTETNPETTKGIITEDEDWVDILDVETRDEDPEPTDSPESTDDPVSPTDPASPTDPDATEETTRPGTSVTRPTSGGNRPTGTSSDTQGSNDNTGGGIELPRLPG